MTSPADPERSPAEWAAVAEQALHALPYAIQDGLDEPAEAAQILTHLVQAFAAVPVTLARLADYIDQLKADGRLRDDADRDLEVAARRIRTAADSTAVSANELVEAIDLARETASSLSIAPADTAGPTP